MNLKRKVAIWASVLAFTGIFLTYSWEVKNGARVEFEKNNPTGCGDFTPGQPQ